MFLYYFCVAWCEVIQGYCINENPPTIHLFYVICLHFLYQTKDVLMSFSWSWQATYVLKSWGICQHAAYTVFSSCVMDCMLISDHKVHDSDFPFGLLCLSLVVWHFVISSKFLKYVYKCRPEYSINKKLKYSVYSVY